MAGSVNKCIIVGNLGRAPELKSFQSGGRVCNLSVATSEHWRDKASGERKERTEWHSVTIYNEHLIGVAERYLKKGSKVYLEGQIETRKYEKDGREVYTTEIVLRPYRGELVLLDGAPDEPGASRAGEFGSGAIGGRRGAERAPAASGGDFSGSRPMADLDDEIPF